jgi:hypothetical protein
MTPSRLASLLLLAACSAPSTRIAEPPANEVPAESPGDHVSLASIRRTPCFGWCPAYEVTVYRDGTVDYTGTAYVKTTGHATRVMSPAELSELEQLFTSNGYMQLADKYTTMSETDMPSVTTSYRPRGGLEKSIDHYLGDGHAPPVLQTVEEGIDRILKIELWIGTDAERRALSHH